MRNCFAYVVKPGRLCVGIFSTTIAGVAYILCGKLYFRIFFANSCLVLTVWIVLDVLVSRRCMLTFEINSQCSK